MNYTTPTFWVLFVFVYALYWRLDHRGQNRLLLIASYIFYGFWDYRFLFLILISTVIDYIGGLGVAGRRLSPGRLWGVLSLLIAAAALLCTKINYAKLGAWLLHGRFDALSAAWPRHASDFLVVFGTVAACLIYVVLLPWLYGLEEKTRRKTFLTISMVANLGILGSFKYFDFFVDTFTALLHSLGVNEVPLQTLNIILPAGISFYTFQAMSYTIDIYRGDAEATEDLESFSLFICFFPHLVAGPIMRAHTLLPQVLEPRQIKPGMMQEGLYLVLIGLFKKMVIADNMARIADSVFFRYADGTYSELTGLETLIGVYAFAFQIYADFSGYSAVARGVSKWLGYELVINFDQPYLAVSPSDFWRRWHISLSTWLRDYLYIPLGGNRGGVSMMYRNLMITMLLGGLWHGAAWTFIAWGLYHGLILCIYRALGIRDNFTNDLAGWAKWAFRWLMMFHLVCIGWLLFRADSFTTCLVMLGRIATLSHLTAFAISALAAIAFYAGPWLVVEAVMGSEVGLPRLVNRDSIVTKTALLTYLILMMLFFRAQGTHDFIYFQF